MTVQNLVPLVCADLEEDVTTDTFDPDNPPLTGKEVWESGREQILKRIDAHKAKYAARQSYPAHVEDNALSVEIPYGCADYSKV